MYSNIFSPPWTFGLSFLSKKGSKSASLVKNDASMSISTNTRCLTSWPFYLLPRFSYCWRWMRSTRTPSTIELSCDSFLQVSMPRCLPWNIITKRIGLTFIFWRKLPIFDPFSAQNEGPEVAKCIRMYIKVSMDIRTTNRIYQNRYSKSLTLNLNYWQKYQFSVIFGPEIKVQRSGKGINLLEFMESR